MNLVYTKNKSPVSVGDEIEIDGDPYLVSYFRKPHHPSSSGRVTVMPRGSEETVGREFYVGVIGAEWINREDR